MPRYTWNDREGYEQAPYYPARLFDANGEEIALFVTSVDTEAGYVEYQVRDWQNRPVIDYEHYRVKTASRCFPAPLTIKPKHPA